MKKNIRRGLGTLFALGLLIGAAWAGPLEDANDRYRAGDYSAALSLLQQARTDAPSDPRVWAALGKTYRRLGDNTSARQAYEQLVRLDPSLSSVSDKQGFLNAYRSLGGELPQAGQAAGSGTAGRATNSSDIIGALTSGDVFVVPGLADQVDANRIQQAIDAVKPRVVKVAVVAKLGGFASRDALANELRSRLQLDDNASVIVATPRGISTSSGRLSRDQNTDAVRGASIDADYSRGGLTEAIVGVVQGAANAVTTDQRQDTGRGAGIVLFIVAAVGGIVGYRAYKNGKALKDAVEPIEAQRQEVLKNLSYVDGYLDLLPAGQNRDNARRLRASAFDKFQTATGLLKTAKTADEVRQAPDLLTDALHQLVECRRTIDVATGGTGVAMGLLETPSLDTDEEKARKFRKAEAVQSQVERDRLQREIENIPPDQRGVSFFSGQPLPSDQLVPVTLVIDGQKRTVMATREEAESIKRGETPPVRAFRDDSGQYVPWYEYRGYDPYRDYYSGYSTLLAASTFVNLLTLTQLMGPGLYGGYGPWGYGGFGWGMPLPPGGFYGYGGPVFGGGYVDGGNYGGNYGGNTGGDFAGQADNSVPDHAGGLDFFGSNYNEQGGGFDTDNGGGGFGGFDFGGGSDSGGGGFDFGGGDSGGGDFGGSGDW